MPIGEWEMIRAQALSHCKYKEGRKERLGVPEPLKPLRKEVERGFDCSVRHCRLWSHLERGTHVG